MPVVLRVICVALFALIVTHAFLALMVEPGLAVVLPIVVDAALFWLLWAFCRRQPETLTFLSKASPVLAALGLVFGVLLGSEDDPWAEISRVHAALELAAWMALFFALRTAAVRTWLEAPQNADAG